MTKRYKVTAYNPLAIWLLILMVAALVIGVTAIIFVIAPAQQVARLSRATADARQAEIERHYASGLAFAQAGDWRAAADAFRQVVALDAGYRDAQAQLTGALTNVAAGEATATAVMVAMAAQQQADAAAAVQAVASATAQALAHLYDHAQGLMALQQWGEAEAELRAVFDVEPNYREVQSLLATVRAQMVAPEATPTPVETATSTSTSAETPSATPMPTNSPTSTPAATSTHTGTPTPNATATALQATESALATLHAIETRQAGVRATQAAQAAVQATQTAQAAVQATQTALPATQTAEARRGDPFTEPVTGMTFVRVPAGEFIMGSSEEEIDDAWALCRQFDSGCGSNWFEPETPQHQVDLDEFWIGQTEITNAQWRLFMEAGGYENRDYWTEGGWAMISSEGRSEPGCWDDSDFSQPDQPVVCISWYEALAYSRWLAEASGLAVRLPTEAEWEKAARGVDGRIFPWGDEWDGSRLNYCDVKCPDKDWNDDSVDDGYAFTALVGSYPAGASPYGALDMAGNVWEWTNTSWGSRDWEQAGFRYPYKADDGREDVNSDAIRMLRGGVWWNDPALARCAVRYGFSPSGWSDLVGVRMVLMSP